MRPIFILSFVAGAYAVGDSYPFDPTANSIKYNDQSTSTTAWKDSGASGQCKSGSNQSPIDIVTDSATIPTDDPGMPMINNLNPKQSYDINIGKSYSVQTTDANGNEVDAEVPADGTGLTIWQKTFGRDATDFGVPTLTGGPFDAGDSYNFAFGEFKWNKDSDTLGSEHSIDGTFAPLELQMVFLKSTTAALTTGAAITATTEWNDHVTAVGIHATADPSAVAVVNYQFEIGDTDNAELAPIITEMVKIVTSGAADSGITGAALPVADFNMSALINPDNTNMLEDYYYYDGSLTLPAGDSGADKTKSGCDEIVRWLLPTTKLSLSQTQLDAIQASDIAVALNTAQGASLARAIKTNANTVYHRKKPTSTDIWQSLATSLLSVGTFGLVHTFLTQPDTAKALTE